MRRIAGLLLLLLPCLLQSQTVIKAVVRDAFNKQPIPAKIYHEDKLLATCDSAGVFNLSIGQNDTLLVSATSYISQPLKIMLNDLPTQIFLIPNHYYNNDIQIMGILIGKNNLHTPKSISNLTRADITRANPAFPGEYFGLLPGVRFDSRNVVASGAKFVIRGVGSQYPGSYVGYKAYLDDTPLTDADGTTYIDDIDFERIGRVEFVRGPVGSIYGNAGYGGTVLLYNNKAGAGNTFGQSYMTGSDGLRKLNTYFGQGNTKTNLLINYSHQDLDGYRMNSSSKKDFININADIISDAKRSVSIYAGYAKTNDLLSGQLDSVNNQNHPDSADLTYLNTKAYTNFETARMSVAQEYKFSNKFYNRTSLFVVTQTITQQIPLTLNKFNKNKFGARTVFIYSPKFGKRQARIVTGAEVIQNINYQKSYNSSATGALGTLKTDQEIKPIMWNVFTELHLQLDQYVSFAAGFSANYSVFDVNDLRVSTSNPLYVNNSGTKRFEPAFLPHVSLSRNFDNHDLYVSYNESNLLPTVDQAFIQRLGKVNDTIGYEKSSTFELGLKGSLFKHALNYQFTLYTLELTNRIIPQNVPAIGSVPAFVLYLNSGGARSNGAEMAFNYTYKPSGGGIDALRLFFNYTYNHFMNADYKSDNNNNSSTKDYSDLPVSGVPQHIINSGFDFLTMPGFYLSFSHLMTDKMPLNLANTSWIDKSEISSARIGWRLHNNDIYQKNKWMIDLFAGANNLFSQKNQTMLFVNATGTATQLPKYFSPGNPNITYYYGVNMSYSF